MLIIILQNHIFLCSASRKWQSIYRLICWNLWKERHRLGGITLISCPPPEWRSVQFLCGFHALTACSRHNYRVSSSLIFNTEFVIINIYIYTYIHAFPNVLFRDNTILKEYFLNVYTLCKGKSKISPLSCIFETNL